MRRFSYSLQKLTKGLVLAMLVVILAGVGNLCSASKPEGPPHALNISLEPSMPMGKNVPITMNLTFSPNPEYLRFRGGAVSVSAGDTGSVSVRTVSLAHGQKLLSKTSWPIKLDDELSYSTTFEIIIPDDDIVKPIVRVTGGALYKGTSRYFRTTEDTVMYRRDGIPRRTVKIVENPHDTLTLEQLQTKYLIGIDLRAPQHLSYAQEILGHLPDSCKVRGRAGIYLIEVSYDNMLKLNEYGIDLDFVRTKPENRSIEDSLEGGNGESNLNK